MPKPWKELRKHQVRLHGSYRSGRLSLRGSASIGLGSQSPWVGIGSSPDRDTAPRWEPSYFNIPRVSTYSIPLEYGDRLCGQPYYDSQGRPTTTAKVGYYGNEARSPDCAVTDHPLRMSKKKAPASPGISSQDQPRPFLSLGRHVSLMFMPYRHAKSLLLSRYTSVLMPFTSSQISLPSST